VTDCLFCRIALGEIPADVVYQDDSVVAFRDIEPQAPVHVLVIPREHVPNVTELTEENQSLASDLMLAAARVAAREGIAYSGYRLVVNNGPDTLQSVHHLHVHVLGGRRLRPSLG